MVTYCIFSSFDFPDSRESDILRWDDIFPAVSKNNTPAGQYRIKRDGFEFNIPRFQDYGLITVQFRIAYSNTPYSLFRYQQRNKYLSRIRSICSH
jgi:hypothetical protein